jgi:Flp pilus assembly pilin Flp
VYASLASHVGGAVKRQLPDEDFGKRIPARKGVNYLLNMIQALTARLKREEGQTIVEYGLVIGGISLVLITLFIVADLGAVFTTLIDNIEAAMT